MSFQEDQIFLEKYLDENLNTVLGLRLAERYISSDNLEGAHQTLTEFLESHPDNSTAMFLLGEIAFKEGNNEKAQNLYEETIQADHSYTAAYHRLITISTDEGDDSTVKDIYALLNRLNPLDSRAASEVGDKGSVSSLKSKFSKKVLKQFTLTTAEPEEESLIKHDTEPVEPATVEEEENLISSETYTEPSNIPLGGEDGKVDEELEEVSDEEDSFDLDSAGEAEEAEETEMAETEDSDAFGVTVEPEENIESDEEDEVNKEESEDLVESETEESEEDNPFGVGTEDETETADEQSVEESSEESSETTDEEEVVAETESAEEVEKTEEDSESAEEVIQEEPAEEGESADEQSVEESSEESSETTDEEEVVAETESAEEVEKTEEDSESAEEVIQEEPAEEGESADEQSDEESSEETSEITDDGEGDASEETDAADDSDEPESAGEESTEEESSEDDSTDDESPIEDSAQEEDPFGTEENATEDSTDTSESSDADPIQEEESETTSEESAEADEAPSEETDINDSVVDKESRGFELPPFSKETLADISSGDLGEESITKTEEDIENSSQDEGADAFSIPLDSGDDDDSENNDNEETTTENMLDEGGVEEHNLPLGEQDETEAADSDIPSDYESWVEKDVTPDSMTSVRDDTVSDGNKNTFEGLLSEPEVAVETLDEENPDDDELEGTVEEIKEDFRAKVDNIYNLDEEEETSPLQAWFLEKNSTVSSSDNEEQTKSEESVSENVDTPITEPMPVPFSGEELKSDAQSDNSDENDEAWDDFVETTKEGKTKSNKDSESIVTEVDRDLQNIFDDVVATDSDDTGKQADEAEEPAPIGGVKLNSDLATFTLAEIYSNQGQYTEALSVLDLLENKGKNPEKIGSMREEIKEKIKAKNK